MARQNQLNALSSYLEAIDSHKVESDWARSFGFGQTLAFGETDGGNIEDDVE